MTNSKKKRRVVVVRNVPIEKNLNFYKNIKIDFLKQLKKELRSYLDVTTCIHTLIDKELIKTKSLKLNQPLNRLNLTKAHVLIDRSALIECVNILDASINHALCDFQLYKCNKEPENIMHYSKAEEGLNECLKKITLSQKFKSKRTITQHFRILRNQFAHNPMGMFFISANQESFESFLKKLEGIKINKSWWVLMNNKAGVAIPFKITSNKFLEIFLLESVVFFGILVELLFPTEGEK